MFTLLGFCVSFRSVWASPPPCLHSQVFVCLSDLCGPPLLHVYTPRFLCVFQICVGLSSSMFTLPRFLCVFQIRVGLPSSMFTLLGFCVSFRSRWATSPPCLHSWVFVCLSDPGGPPPPPCLCSRGPPLQVWGRLAFPST